MSELKAEMEFEIGDVVYFKTSLHDKHHTPRKFTVVGRIVEECHGGVQRHFKVASFGDCFMASYIELTKECPPYSPDPYYDQKHPDPFAGLAKPLKSLQETINRAAEQAK